MAAKAAADKGKPLPGVKRAPTSRLGTASKAKEEAAAAARERIAAKKAAEEEKRQSRLAGQRGATA